jgi:hypothetical protein
MDFIDNPRKAELFAAETLKRWGFGDATATAVGADGGIDVWSRRGLAQVKFKGSVAGRPELQQLRGAAGKDTDKALFFFSGAGYSAQAVEYAKQVGMSLFIFDLAGNLEQVNGTVRPTGTGHSWTSTDWLALLRGGRRVLGLVAAGTTNKKSRRSKRRR